MDKELKKAKMRKFLMVFLPFFVISMWIATQNIAKDCAYDPILGTGFTISDMKIYAPWMFFVWKVKFGFVIPIIINSAQKYLIIGSVIGFFLGAFVVKNMQNLSSYGTAKWASSKDIRKAGIGQPDGVTIGINPYKFKSYADENIFKKLLHDNGPAHIGVFAPTRSGKGAAIIIPTCLEWKNSLVVLDLKGENFNFTASYRKKALKNKIIKFEPFCEDGTSAKWNPIAEIRMGTNKEISDVMSLAHMIADPTGKGGEKGDSHWIDTSTALIQTVILHLLYAHKRQDLPVPTLSDVSNFLSSKAMPFDDAIEQMKGYAHISTKDFFENNVLEKIYGNYILSDFEAFNKNLADKGIIVDSIRLKEIKLKLREEPPELIEKYSSKFRTIREIQEYYKDEFKNGNLNFEEEDSPFNVLLTHPKVADGAAECQNRDAREQGSVTSSANAKFNLYRDPIIAKNTSCSEFVSTDVMNPNQPLTIYLVIPPNKVQDAIPLIRIFINYVLDRNMESMKFSESKKKQRCLFLLDEFPQLGRIEKMETGMAIMAGYGLKVLLIAQDVNQVNKNYSKDNSIISNCHIRIFYTPNDTETAKNICDFLGKETIKVANESQAGSFKTNKSWNQAGRELLTLSEITQLPKDDEIILMAGLPPIKAKKAWYFKIKYFMNRCKNKTYPEAIAFGLKSDKATVIDSYEALDRLNGLIEDKHKTDDKEKSDLTVDDIMNFVNGDDTMNSKLTITDHDLDNEKAIPYDLGDISIGEGLQDKTTASLVEKMQAVISTEIGDIDKAALNDKGDNQTPDETDKKKIGKEDISNNQEIKSNETGLNNDSSAQIDELKPNEGDEENNQVPDEQKEDTNEIKSDKIDSSNNSSIVIDELSPDENYEEDKQIQDEHKEITDNDTEVIRELEQDKNGEEDNSIPNEQQGNTDETGSSSSIVTHVLSPDENDKEDNQIPNEQKEDTHDNEKIKSDKTVTNLFDNLTEERAVEIVSKEDVIETDDGYMIKLLQKRYNIDLDNAKDLLLQLDALAEKQKEEHDRILMDNLNECLKKIKKYNTILRKVC
ncbi:type IV secretory system conjugative DNA transfer family protein [Megamonas hypermegale]|uniref:type IV secretory system conjugative DNA transfer family protein n=1 Tax=Megamonas hypermegale TaxID=158847 RepID=UPI002430BC28|nr:type IV secretory system conjugative DNA transfer family protein [Megamonas hypermegale]